MSKKIDRILNVIDDALHAAAASGEDANPFERFCTIGRDADDGGTATGESPAPAVT